MEPIGSHCVRRPSPWGPLILAACISGCAPLGDTRLAPSRELGPDWQAQDLALAGHGHLLTSEERDVVLHINLARTNPGAYARTFLLPRRVLFRGTIYIDPLDPRGRGLRTREGSPAVEEAAAAMRETAPMAPLAVSGALTRAARRHADEQSVTGDTGHFGRGDSQPSSRVDEEATWERFVGEVAAYGPTSGREIVSRLLIDDGVRNRGHRHSILDPRFGVVGVAIAPHPRYGRAVVVDFADAVAEPSP